MTTEYRATEPQVEELTVAPAPTGSPARQFLQQVGKVHAVAVVDDLTQYTTACGLLARPTDRPFSDVPADEQCPACAEAVGLD
jgi:hypothetical protein